jgi:hypothetical protein
MTGCLTASVIEEVQAAGSLVQGLLIAGGIAEVTVGGLLDQSSGLGIILLLADDLLHRTNLLFSEINNCIIHNTKGNARKIFAEMKLFSKFWSLRWK